MKIFLLIYSKPENEETIRLFNPYFVLSNKNKCKIIFQNKLYPLEYEYDASDIKRKKLKIKLICFNNISDINDFTEEFESYKIYESKKYIKKNKVFRYSEYFKFSNHKVLRMIYRIDIEKEKGKGKKEEIKGVKKKEIKKEKREEIQIFGEEFVRNNKNKGIIVYKDEFILLQTHLLIKNIDKEDKENKKFEILLIEFEDILNRSYMFHNCDLLVEFLLFKNNKKEIIDLPNDEID